MHLRIYLLTVAFWLSCFLTTQVCLAQKRGPSAQKERTEFMSLMLDLETNPLGEKGKETRQKLRLWIKEVPDLTIPICNRILGPVAESNEKYGREISDQMVISSAAFAIKYPEQAENRHAVLVAGLKGALRVYETILKTKPGAKWRFLDNLLKRESANELSNYVQEVMDDKCIYFPLSKTNKQKYEAGDTVYASSEVDRKPIVKKKYEPQYTEQARARRIGGRVVVHAVLASSGKVTDITVVKSLPYGLTEAAVEAARQIKFEPAIKDGHPVSMFIRLEYNFHP